MLIESRFADLLNSIAKPAADLDYKTRLQEFVQQTYGEAPVYHLIDESGPDHDKTFRAGVVFAGLKAEGVGKSKKMAEQEAARKALKLLNNE
jgi:dsRNA-specific ribonuclease